MESLRIGLWAAVLTFSLASGSQAAPVTYLFSGNLSLPGDSLNIDGASFERELATRRCSYSKRTPLSKTRWIALVRRTFPKNSSMIT